MIVTRGLGAACRIVVGGMGGVVVNEGAPPPNLRPWDGVFPFRPVDPTLAYDPSLRVVILPPGANPAVPLRYDVSDEGLVVVSHDGVRLDAFTIDDAEFEVFGVGRFDLWELSWDTHSPVPNPPDPQVSEGTFTYEVRTDTLAEMRSTISNMVGYAAFAGPDVLVSGSAVTVKYGLTGDEQNAAEHVFLFGRQNPATGEDVAQTIAQAGYGRHLRIVDGS